MEKILRKGVYPTMLTPFRDGKIDYKAVDQILDFYLQAGVKGVFALCQSSEMAKLSLSEKVTLSKHIVEYVDGRANVIASGCTAYAFEEQVQEIESVWATGVDAVILNTNRLDVENLGDDVFLANLEKLLSAIDKDILLGIYECPDPYKRLLTPRIIQYMLKTNRFRFIKDTCCDESILKERLELLKDTSLMLFNANAQTLLYSLKEGASGYSGIMANFHPQLYTWLCENTEHENAKYLSDLLSFGAMIENNDYPVSGKYALVLNGIDMTLEARSTTVQNFTPYRKMLVENLHSLAKETAKLLKI